MSSSDSSQDLHSLLLDSDASSPTGSSTSHSDSDSSIEEIIAAEAQTDAAAADPTEESKALRTRDRNALLLSLLETASRDTFSSIANTRTAHASGIRLQAHHRYLPLLALTLTPPSAVEICGRARSPTALSRLHRGLTCLWLPRTVLKTLTSLSCSPILPSGFAAIRPRNSPRPCIQMSPLYWRPGLGPTLILSLARPDHR